MNNGTPGQTNGQTPNGVPINANGTPNYTGTNLLSLQSNSDTTGFVRMGFHSGVRFDLGYLDEDTNAGWLFSAFRLASTTQSTNTANAGMVIDDGSSTDTLGTNIQPANVYNGIPAGGITYANPNAAVAGQPATFTTTAGAGITALPLLYGFVDRTGGGTTGLAPDGFPDDLNHNNLYGAEGRDRGTVPTNGTNTTLATGTTLAGKPIAEGSDDTLTAGGSGFSATGPAPGQPQNGTTYQPSIMATRCRCR